MRKKSWKEPHSKGKPASSEWHQTDGLELIIIHRIHGSIKTNCTKTELSVKDVQYENTVNAKSWGEHNAVFMITEAIYISILSYKWWFPMMQVFDYCSYYFVTVVDNHSHLQMCTHYYYYLVHFQW